MVTQSVSRYREETRNRYVEKAEHGTSVVKKTVAVQYGKFQPFKNLFLEIKNITKNI